MPPPPVITFDNPETRQRYAALATEYATRPHSTEETFTQSIVAHYNTTMAPEVVMGLVKAAQRIANEADGNTAILSSHDVDLIERAMKFSTARSLINNTIEMLPVYKAKFGIMTSPTAPVAVSPPPVSATR